MESRSEKFVCSQRRKTRYHEERSKDTQVEVARFEDAKQKAIDQLHALYEKALKEVGEVNAQIFDVHAMMLDDGDYIDSIHNLIEGQECKCGIRGGCRPVIILREMFADMDDEYFKARAAGCQGYFRTRDHDLKRANDTASDIG